MANRQHVQISQLFDSTRGGDRGCDMSHTTHDPIFAILGIKLVNVIQSVQKRQKHAFAAGAV